MAAVDDCIPLSQSVKTASGKELTEIPVPKGQRVLLSIPGYNRCILFESEWTRMGTDMSPEINPSLGMMLISSGQNGG